jgi:hypothetical protein
MHFTQYLFLVLLFLSSICSLKARAQDYSKPWIQQFSINNSYYKKAETILIFNVTYGCGNGKTTDFKFKDFKIAPLSGEQEISLELRSDNTAKALCSYHQVKLQIKEYPELSTRKNLKVWILGNRGKKENFHLANFKIRKPPQLPEQGILKKFKRKGHGK